MLLAPEQLSQPLLGHGIALMDEQDLKDLFGFASLEAISSKAAVIQPKPQVAEHPYSDLTDGHHSLIVVRQ